MEKMSLKDIVGPYCQTNLKLFGYSIHNEKDIGNVIKLAKKHNIKIFVQKFEISSSMQRPGLSPYYMIYESRNSLGKMYRTIEHNKGLKYFCVYDYDYKIKIDKINYRKHMLYKFKKAKLKRLEKYKNEFITSFLKLNN